MTAIVAPLRSGQSGPQVANLQDALLALVDHRIIRTGRAPEGPTAEQLEILTERVKVERAGARFGEATAALVDHFRRQQGLGDGRSGLVDAATAEALNRRLDGDGGGGVPTTDGRAVRGVVRLADGSGAGGLAVSVFSRALRAELPLGKGATDKGGQFDVPVRTLRGAGEGTSVDLVVKVSDPAGVLLVTSPVLFDAPAVAVVDLTIPVEVRPPPPLFDRITAAVQPLLDGAGIATLEEDDKHQDLSFLAGKTGLDRAALARFAITYRLAQQGLQAELWFALLTGALFQYDAARGLAAQAAAVLDRLAGLDAAAVNKAIVRAVNQRDIAPSLAERAPAWTEAFLAFVAGRVVSAAPQGSLARAALVDAGINNPDKQLKFASLLLEHKAMTPALVEALDADPSFAKEEVADLETSFRLADLTRGDFSVVKALKESFELREPEQIRSLARMGEGQWVDLVQKKYAVGQLVLPIDVGPLAERVPFPSAEIYGKALERQFREAFPSASFAGGLDRALSNGGVHGIRRAKDVQGFLAQHPDFELLSTPIDTFLDNGVQPASAELAADDDFRRELKAIQRVFKLVPNFDGTETLRTDGIHSAQAVYRVGETQFVRRYGARPGFTPETARIAWSRAAETHAAVVTIVGDLLGFEKSRLPAALTSITTTPVPTFPNWDKLFQDGDVCACDHCGSVLGPAAYYADLLLFLRDRDAGGRHTVRDVLYQRRPDLGYLELSCPNALTPLPYVDVVCEVLEAAIAGGADDLPMPGLGPLPPDPALAKLVVLKAFTALGVSLGADFTLEEVVPGDFSRVVIHGDDVTYLLTAVPGTRNYDARVLPNTKTSADELRAYPQYVSAAAYEKLRAVSHPFGLPFDLDGQEVRTTLGKAGLERWEVMRVLRNAPPPGNPTNPTDAEIAAEYLGISVDASAAIDEKRLIFQEDLTVAGQQEISGEPGNAGWLGILRKVNNFLVKTGLAYQELFALLDLKFINPTGTVWVEHNDLCDTSRKLINGLDAPTLDRIHRFLRLWRKLKDWQMWELDLALDRSHRIDDGLLLELYRILRLKNRLGGTVTVEQTLALFGKLPANSHFAGIGEPRADGLYQRLFLNRLLVRPLDSALALDKVAVQPPTTEKISGHRPAVLAALNVSERDLAALMAPSAPAAAPYIGDDLTLDNLSLLWRHAWLSARLKINATDWRLLIAALGRNPSRFASAMNVLDFLDLVDLARNSGFSPDELSWVLAANRQAKAATHETDAGRFLSGLRKDVQLVQASNSAAGYDVLVPGAADDETLLEPLVTGLLQKLNRTDAEAQAFLATVRGPVVLEAPVQGLPVGFAFKPALTGPPNFLPVEYDEPARTLRFSGLMTEGQRDILLTDGSLGAVASAPEYRSAIALLYQAALAAPTRYVVTRVNMGAAPVLTMPAGLPALPIRLDPGTGTLTFVGLMSSAERLALKNAGNAADPIDQLYLTPRLGVKFFELVFTAPLDTLPPSVDFDAQLPDALAARIAHDAEQRLLRITGFLTKDEQAALEALAPGALPVEQAYRTAVALLASQPGTIADTDERVWMAATDLDPTQAAADTVAKRLVTAATKALAYLSRTLSASVAVSEAAAQLGLSEALTRAILTRYDLALGAQPTTLLAHLTGTFAATSGAVDYAAAKTTFDGWFWAVRVAAVLKKWTVSLEALERLAALPAAANVLDLADLPLDATGAAASGPVFLETGRLLAFRTRVPETSLTFLELLGRLGPAAYTATELGKDVELLNPAWTAADTEALVSALDIAFPDGYLHAAAWERLARAFTFLDRLGAGAATAMTFSAATMTPVHARTLKELMRAKLGAETWLALSTEIQDALRERKRDALVAFLLTQPRPADAPTAEWETPDNVYAYYLLDVQMGACMLTSRLVQAAGSVQLFVQRCHMGLEPAVTVQADGPDGDSAWQWWTWMRKYSRLGSQPQGLPVAGELDPTGAEGGPIGRSSGRWRTSSCRAT